MGNSLRDGNIERMGVIQTTLNPASVAANTSAEQTFTVQGLVVGDMVVLRKPAITVGITVTNPTVPAPNTLAVTFGNHTAATIDPNPEIYQLMWFRTDETGPFPGGLPGSVAI